MRKRLIFSALGAVLFGMNVFAAFSPLDTPEMRDVPAAVHIQPVENPKPVAVKVSEIQTATPAETLEPIKTQKTKKHTKKKKAVKVNEDDVYRLAQLIYAENGDSKYDECLVLTGIVVIKRMRSKGYPNTLGGVICQKGQYATFENGLAQSCVPDSRSLEIAEEILRYDLQKNYPDNLVFQSEFKQGKRVYAVYGHEYFCLA